MTKLQTARAACSGLIAPRGLLVRLICIACSVETPEAERLFDEIMRQQAAERETP